MKKRSYAAIFRDERSVRGAQDELRPEDLAHQPLDHLALLRGAWLKRDDVAEHVALRMARVTALAGRPWASDSEPGG